MGGATVDIVVGGLCPSGLSADAPYCSAITLGQWNICVKERQPDRWERRMPFHEPACDTPAVI
jgi:hypothetical protein